MIPKKIHYCWFGKKSLSKFAIKCIASWKQHCPDYEIIEWNENNFDINYCDYVKQAYNEKKYAFVSDVARLYALVNYGGIYMDVDVEVIKNLDVFLKYKAFTGFESNLIMSISTGIIGSEKDNVIFREFLNEYQNIKFVRERNTYIVNNVRLTNIFKKYGLKENNKKQIIRDVSLFPAEYFSPLDPFIRREKVTSNTYVIHHYVDSWGDIKDKLYILVCKYINKTFADKLIKIKRKLFDKIFHGTV